VPPKSTEVTTFCYIHTSLYFGFYAIS